MKLEEANKRLNILSNKPFKELFSQEDMNSIIRNKGKTGQLLELALGLHLSNTNLDFEDGELKTNKCDNFGKPRETIFITQIGGIIDELIQVKPFEETHLYEKIKNILYVPVCKDGDPRNWKFLPSIQVNYNFKKYAELYSKLKEDYCSICKQLKSYIDNSSDEFIHTSSGQYIQIRSKDSKPYHPIFSNIYNRNVSNKNHAFYFKKEFVYYIQSINK